MNTLPDVIENQCAHCGNVELSDADITACALMIKGVFLNVEPPDWLNAIEGRIRCLLSQASKGNGDVTE